jgi:hypothetical protein
VSAVLDIFRSRPEVASLLGVSLESII